MPLPESHSGEIISASIQLVKALGNAYGSDTAMEFWGNLADTVDPDLKGLVFAAMLSGSGSSGLIIKDLPTEYNRVKLVRVIRQYDSRDLSIRDTLNLIDGLANNGTPIYVHVPADKYGMAKFALGELGIEF